MIIPAEAALGIISIINSCRLFPHPTKPSLSPEQESMRSSTSTLPAGILKHVPSTETIIYMHYMYNTHMSNDCFAYYGLLSVFN